ncbi:MAG: hypothetical protein M3443_14965 [Actinomycetota bacterium]|nr:hypothetical protein [Actinomycetota bacterium]
MAGDSGLGNLRFEGYSPQAMADELDKLRQGPGSESLFRAVEALMQIADGLGQTDRALREQLASIGVFWQGAASEGGHAATQEATIYADQAVPTVTSSAGGVSEQGEMFSHTSSRAPDGGELRGPTQLNGADRFLGMFGHTTDNAEKVAATNAAHQQAVSSMNGYREGSQSALGNYQSLPVPPGMDLVAKPVTTTGTTSAQGFEHNPSSFTPAGGADTTAGAPSRFAGNPGGAPHQFGTLDGDNRAPNSSNQPGGGPGNPGRVSGVGPLGPNLGGLNNPAGPFPGGRPGFPSGLMGDLGTAAGIAGGAGAAAAGGSTARKDSVVRGGGTAATGGVSGKEAAGKGAQADAAARSRAGAVAGVPDEQAKAARNAERIGAKAGRPAGLMQPAAGGASASGEEDGEHVRKYGIDSEDVFGDERLVIAPVLGQDD